MQGWRISASEFRAADGAFLLTLRLLTAMEDSHAIVLDLDEQKTERNAFFAVYDGHGGKSSLLLFDHEITLSRRHCR